MAGSCFHFGAARAALAETVTIVSVGDGRMVIDLHLDLRDLGGLGTVRGASNLSGIPSTYTVASDLTMTVPIVRKARPAG